MKKIFLVFLFSSILFLTQKSFAQLSGTYTIGGVSPDFARISIAYSAMVSQGISGPVVFNIRPGIYNDSIVGTYIAGASNINTITFQSENHDSSSVIINSTSVSFFYTSSNLEYYIFKQITLNSGVDGFDELRNINIINCNIHCTSNAFYLEYGYDTVINSFISGVMTQSTPNSPIYFYHNTTDGAIYFSRSIFLNNTLLGGDSCIMSLQNSIIKNNIMECGTDIFNGAPIIEDNEFYYTAQLHGIGTTVQPSIVVHNKMYEGMEADYCSGTIFDGNLILEGLDNGIGLSDSVLVCNNFIFGEFEISYFHYSKIVSNNFSPSSSFLYMWGCYYDSVRNNNFSQPVYQYFDSACKIFQNNYYPASGSDSVQTNFNPEYNDTSDLHAHNLHLIGIGGTLPYVRYDIDSVLRKKPPTMGANEICLSGDTFNLACGDSVPLVMCNAPDTGNFIWTPSVGLNNSTIASPIASPSINTLYKVVETLSGYSDSVYVKVIPFNPAFFRDTSVSCGNVVELYASYNAGAIYHWSPATGLSDTDSYHTLATPLLSTTYVVSITVPGCGITYDTLRIKVDSLPTVNIVYSDSCLTAIFYNTTTCATNYYWDFGDGSTSNSVNPSHTYDTGGSYYLIMLGCNSYGCDTIAGYISVQSCVITGFQNIHNVEDFKYFPNPTKKNITVEYELTNLSADVQIELMDIYGNEVFLRNLAIDAGTHSYEFDLSAYPSGIYFLIFQTGNDRITHKVILQK